MKKGAENNFEAPIFLLLTKSVYAAFLPDLCLFFFAKMISILMRSEVSDKNLRGRIPVIYGLGEVANPLIMTIF